MNAPEFITQKRAPGRARTGRQVLRVMPSRDGRTSQPWVMGMGTQSTFARTILVREKRGIPLRSEPPKNGAEKTHLSSALPPLTTQELTREVQGVVLQFPTAEVVDDTQASLRAIENVRNGESGMSLKTFVNLLRANPRARAMAAPLLGYGFESDPEVVGAIDALINRLVRPGAEPCEPTATPSEAEIAALADLFGGQR